MLSLDSLYPILRIADTFVFSIPSLSPSHLGNIINSRASTIKAVMLGHRTHIETLASIYLLGLSNSAFKKFISSHDVSMVFPKSSSHHLIPLVISISGSLKLSGYNINFSNHKEWSLYYFDLGFSLYHLLQLFPVGSLSSRVNN